jgi:hypothetical protein
MMKRRLLSALRKPRITADFRSDTLTWPTQSMLEYAMNNCSLGDDVYEVFSQINVNYTTQQDKSRKMNQRKNLKAWWLSWPGKKLVFFAQVEQCRIS